MQNQTVIYCANTKTGFSFLLMQNDDSAALDQKNSMSCQFLPTQTKMNLQKYHRQFDKSQLKLNSKNKMLTITTNLHQ